MSWRGYTDEQLVQAVKNSSPELLAHHLRNHDARVAELEADYQAKLAHHRATLTLAQRIGGEVLRARRAGRRTIRLSDLPTE